MINVSAEKLKRDPLLAARELLCSFINPEFNDVDRIESRHLLINNIQKNGLGGFYDYIKNIASGNIVDDDSLMRYMEKAYIYRQTNGSSFRSFLSNAGSSSNSTELIFGFGDTRRANDLNDPNDMTGHDARTIFDLVTSPVECCQLLLREYVVKLEEEHPEIKAMSAHFNYIDEPAMQRVFDDAMAACDKEILASENEGDADKAEALRKKATALANFGYTKKSIEVLLRIGRKSIVDTKMFILLNSLMRAAIAIYDYQTVLTYLPQLQTTALNLGFEQRSKLRVCEALCFLIFPRLASANRLLILNFESDKTNSSSASLRKNSKGCSLMTPSQKGSITTDSALIEAINSKNFSSKTLESSLKAFVDPKLLLENILLSCERLIPSLATFSAEEYISYDEFVEILTVCLIVVAPRQFMTKAFDGMSEAREILRKKSDLEVCFHSVIKCRYDKINICVENLGRVSRRNSYLMLLREIITEELRRRTYEQFLSTYKEVNIEEMSRQFEIDTDILLKQLEVYMQNGDLDAKINLVDNTVMCTSVEESTENIAAIMSEARTILRKLEAIRKGIIL